MVPRWCPGGVAGVSRWCASGVPMVSRCPGSVPVAPQPGYHPKGGRKGKDNRTFHHLYCKFVLSNPNWNHWVAKTCNHGKTPCCFSTYWENSCHVQGDRCLPPVRQQVVRPGEPSYDVTFLFIVDFRVTF